jgi:hypothetical protein
MMSTIMVIYYDDWAVGRRDALIDDGADLGFRICDL